MKTDKDFKYFLEKFCKHCGLKLLIETFKESKHCAVTILGRCEERTWFTLDPVSNASVDYATKRLLHFSSASENGLSGEETACQVVLLFIFEASSIVYRMSSGRWKWIDVSSIRTVEQLEIICDLEA